MGVVLTRLFEFFSTVRGRANYPVENTSTVEELPFTYTTQSYSSQNLSRIPSSYYNTFFSAVRGRSNYVENTPYSWSPGDELPFTYTSRSYSPNDTFKHSYTYSSTTDDSCSAETFKNVNDTFEIIRRKRIITKKRCNACDSSM